MISFSYVNGYENDTQFAKSNEENFDLVSESKRVDELLDLLDVTFNQYLIESTDANYVYYEGIVGDLFGGIGHFISGIFGRLINWIKEKIQKIKDKKFNAKSTKDKLNVLIKNHPEYKSTIVEIIPLSEAAKTSSYKELEELFYKLQDSCAHTKTDDIDKYVEEINKLKADIANKEKTIRTQKVTISQLGGIIPQLYASCEKTIMDIGNVSANCKNKAALTLADLEKQVSLLENQEKIDNNQVTNVKKSLSKLKTATITITSMLKTEVDKNTNRIANYQATVDALANKGNGSADANTKPSSTDNTAASEPSDANKTTTDGSELSKAVDKGTKDRTKELKNAKKHIIVKNLMKRADVVYNSSDSKRRKKSKLDSLANDVDKLLNIGKCTDADHEVMMTYINKLISSL